MGDLRVLKMTIECPGLTNDEIEEIVNKHIGEEFGLYSAQMECREKLLERVLVYMKEKEKENV